MDLNYIGSTQEIVEMVNLQESIRAKCITYLERAEKLKEYIKVVLSIISCCQMPMKHMESHHYYVHYSSLMLKTMLVLRSLTITHCYSLFRGTEWVSSFQLEC